MQSEDSVVCDPVSDSLATLTSSPVGCSSDKADYESTSQPHHHLATTTATATAAVIPETICDLPRDIEDDLNDEDTDCSLDVSGVSTDEFLQIHTKIAEQRNSYRRKCIQVSNVAVIKIELN